MNDLQNQEKSQKSVLSVNHASESLKKIEDRVNFEAEFPNPQDICAQISYIIV